MAPTKANGRPKIAWNPSRNRKLVRLYFFTDLNIQAIQDVISEPGFAPRRRNIQMQLKILLPDNSKTWREHRPSSKTQGQSRLAQLKKSRESHVSKHLRRHPHSPKPPEVSGNGTIAISRLTGGESKTASIPSGEGLPPGIPSHDICPSLDFFYPRENGNASIEEKPDSEESEESRWSDKEVVSTVSTSSVLDENTTMVPAAMLLDEEPPSLPAVEIYPPKSSATSESTLANYPGSTSLDSVYSSRIARMASVNSYERDSIRTSSARLSNNSGSRSHINSVLSASISWRSSLIYTPSVSSGRRSTMHNRPWSRADFDTWSEFVDESMISSSYTRPKDEVEKSLRHPGRPCCGHFGNAPSLCETCGYSESHWCARNLHKLPFPDTFALDHFGNTTLHHAAAAGNTIQLLKLMSAANRPSPGNSEQNTSGETFLHVFRLRSPDDFPMYEKVLKKASDQGFPFETLDYFGRSISQRLEELVDDWSTIDRDSLSNAAHILGLGDDFECRDGRLRAKNSDLSWYEYEGRFLGRFSDFNMRFARLSSWSQAKSQAELRELVQDSDIHMRDSKGYTALAIAAGNGMRDVVSILLQAGANPNTRSHHKTSVMEYATRQLARAQKEFDDSLYAQILSCMALLSDNGGKVNVSVYDEYSLVQPRQPRNSSHSGLHSASTARNKSAHLSVPGHQLESIAEPSDLHRQEGLEDVECAPPVPQKDRAPETDTLPSRRLWDLRRSSQSQETLQKSRTRGRHRRFRQVFQRRGDSIDMYPGSHTVPLSSGPIIPPEPVELDGMSVPLAELESWPVALYEKSVDPDHFSTELYEKVEPGKSKDFSLFGAPETLPEQCSVSTPVEMPGNNMWNLSTVDFARGRSPGGNQDFSPLQFLQQLGTVNGSIESSESFNESSLQIWCPCGFPRGEKPGNDFDISRHQETCKVYRFQSMCVYQPDAGDLRSYMKPLAARPVAQGPSNSYQPSLRGFNFGFTSNSPFVGADASHIVHLPDSTQAGDLSAPPLNSLPNSLPMSIFSGNTAQDPAICNKAVTTSLDQQYDSCATVLDPQNLDLDFARYDPTNVIYQTYTGKHTRDQPYQWETNNSQPEASYNPNSKGKERVPLDQDSDDAVDQNSGAAREPLSIQESSLVPISDDLNPAKRRRIAPPLSEEYLDDPQPSRHSYDNQFSWTLETSSLEPGHALENSGHLPFGLVDLSTFGDGNAFLYDVGDEATGMLNFI